MFIAYVKFIDGEIKEYPFDDKERLTEFVMLRSNMSAYEIGSIVYWQEIESRREKYPKKRYMGGWD